MIGTLYGKIIEKNNNIIIVNTGNIGYEVFVLDDITLKKGNTIFIYTQMIVRETNISLYGFKTLQEKNLFNKLLIVNGIGPKAAMDILGQVSPEVLIKSIISSDVSSLSRIKGIGPKTAEKIIFTLKEKFEKEKSEVKTTKTTKKANELVQALVFLGYTESQSEEIADKIFDEEKELPELIKLAIKEIRK